MNKDQNLINEFAIKTLKENLNVMYAQIWREGQLTAEYKRMPVKTTAEKMTAKRFPTMPSKMMMTRKLRSKISSPMKSKRKKIKRLMKLKLRLFRLRFSRFRSRKSKQFLKLT